MKMPVFTVVIPTKDRASMLVAAIKSVQQQTFSEWELIIVDNGSTDDTQAVVQRFLSDKIRYLYNDRTEGPAASRNMGINAASPASVYISLLDDDDSYYPGFLAHTYSALERSADDVGFSWTGVEYYYPHNGKSTKFFWNPRFQGKEEAFEGFLKTRLIGTGYGITFKKEVFSVVGMFDETLRAVEDTDFFLRVLKFYFYKNIPETLVRITRLTTNHVNRDSFEKAEALQTIYGKHRDRIVQNTEAWYGFIAKISSIYYRLGARKKGRSVLKASLNERFNFRLILLWLRLELS